MLKMSHKPNRLCGHTSHSICSNSRRVPLIFLHGKPYILRVPSLDLVLKFAPYNMGKFPSSGSTHGKNCLPLHLMTATRYNCALQSKTGWTCTQLEIFLTQIHKKMTASETGNRRGSLADISLWYKQTIVSSTPSKPSSYSQHEISHISNAVSNVQWWIQ